MWKEAKQTGVSLAELLVVLAITVVLAAILLPALATPNPNDAGTRPAMDTHVASVDGLVVPRSRAEREATEAEAAPALDEVAGDEPTVEFVPAFNTSGAEVFEREGLEQIKTTDISYELQ